MQFLTSQLGHSSIYLR